MTITSDIATLQAVYNQFKGSGITNFGGAVSALQAAGNAAVNSIGPAIDALSGGSSDVMKITQWAWAKNGTLAGETSDDSATQASLTSALSDVSQMLAWYNQANRLAASKVSVAPKSATVTATYVAPKVTATTSLLPPPLASKALATAPTAPLVTSLEVAATGAGGVLGFAIGARAISLAVGGPIGLLLGAGAGFLITKALKK